MTIAIAAGLFATAAFTQPAAQIATPVSPAVQAAARAGDAAAQFALAEAYRTGQGVAVDREQAITWYRRAADQGNLPARDALGTLLFTRGNRQEAMPLIEAAAARGDARALYILATARFNGDYVARDWPRAYAEMSRAADMGLPQAKRSLALMEPYLLPADRARAEQIRATLAAVAAPGVAATPATAASTPPMLSSTPTLPVNRAFPVPSAQTLAAHPPIVAGRGQPVAAAMLPAPTQPITNRTLPAPAAGTPAAQPPIVATPTIPPPPRPTPPAPVGTARGSWRVQLGAYGSSDRAEGQWATLAAKVPALARLDRKIAAVGAVVRLQAEGLADRDAADTLCRQVTAAGGACFTLPPAP